MGRLYNFMVGMDTLAQVVNDESWYQSSLPDGVLPKVIHYTGDKPWYHLSKNRYRSIWWFYYSVEWSDILLRKNPIKGQLLSDFNTLIDPPLFHTAIFTDSCELEQIERLLIEFPQVHFSILAHTSFASSVIDLQQFSNVSVYPGFIPFTFDEVLKNLDFYLDINHGNQIADIISKVRALGKPIYSFDVTNHDDTGYNKVYEVSDVMQMIKDIKMYLGTIK